MTAVILAEPDLTGGPSPRMGVSLSGWSADGPVDVYRVHPDTSRHLVRGMSAVSGGAAFGWDYEAPFLVPVHYEADDAGVTVSSFGPVERINRCTNPQPTTTAGYTGLGGVTTAAAPWNASRTAVTATATGSATHFMFSATGGAGAIGDVVTVSAMLQCPAGIWYRPTVHVRTGNTYYAAGVSYVLSDGNPVRVTCTATLTAAAVDVDLAVLFGSNAGGGTVPAGTITYMGDVIIEDGPDGGAYFDGDTAPDVDHAVMWEGAANASRSDLRALEAVLDVDQVWVSVPGLPAYAVPVELVRKPSPARGRESTALRPMGRARPIVLSDVLGSPDFAVTLRTKTLNDADSLEQTVAAAGTLLLRIPGIRQAWQYVAATGLQEVPYTDYRAPAGAPVNHPGNWTDWQLGGPVVDSPVGGVFGDPTASYQVLVDTYADYSAVLATEADYVDVLKGVVT